MNKTSTLSLLFLFPTFLNAQLLNGSFETNNGTPSIANWQNVCYTPQSFNDGAPNWGNYCIKQDYGNPQGCFPSFVFQTIPDMDDGEVWTVSGWVRIDSLWAPTNVGIFAGKVDENNAVSTSFGDWANTPHWVFVSKTDSVHLAPNEVGAVVLMAGLVPGPLYGFAFFDGIKGNEEIPTQVAENATRELSVFPSPAEGVLYLGSGLFSGSVDVRIYDLTGQVEQEFERLEPNNGTTLKLDVSTLAAGLHVVQVSQGSHVVTRRFYKK